EGKLVRLPTGDGMALVFSSSPEAPVRCALEISEALKNHPQIALRMGINTGPVSGVADVNDRSNVAGAGINNAQRVMAFGDAGHILLSKRSAEDLLQYRQWKPYLHELGEFEVKHGQKIAIVNLYTEKLGNREVPQKIKQAEREKRGRRKRKRVLIGALFLLAFAAVGGLSIFLRRTGQNVVAPVIPEKSIAVLPFESFSEDKENAYFADGIQDDVLTHLAKVADLKVISRTSVMKYRGAAAQNLREIGRALQVAHVLEGSVRKAGARVRVNAQLIDVRTDAHLWAEQYDRDLADIFSIQSELAERIVAQLKSALSPSEKAAIEVKPTSDLEAYDLYLRGKALMNNLWKSSDPHSDLLKALEFFKAATLHDPNFALAYCDIGRTSLDLYWWWGYAAADLMEAEKAVQTALRLAPNLGQAHLEQGNLYYHGHRNYKEALKAFDKAERLLPNSNVLLGWKGAIQRRIGKWDEAIRSHTRATELDPLKEGTYYELVGDHRMMRNYSAAERVIDIGLMKIPEAGNLFRWERAEIAFAKGNLKTFHTLSELVPKDYQNQYYVALAALIERNYAQASTILAGIPQPEHDADVVFLDALVLRKQGNAAKAQAILLAERERTQNKKLGEAGEPQKLAFLALLDAALNRKEEALRESQQSVDKLPISRDAVDGPLIATRQAQIYALVGERDRAIDVLSRVATIPAGPSVGDLLHPAFDDLRGDPRFEKIVDSLKPK
ncbi:MAG TPA: adenylate/guanylate cyclase domain-containing protein, partial [Chthoniobacterales bacterium]|nr:adenylate/guanylate cyclase domain-containing protein [Chthoniobacterales bacterium]